MFQQDALFADFRPSVGDSCCRSRRICVEDSTVQEIVAEERLKRELLFFVNVYSKPKSCGNGSRKKWLTKGTVNFMCLNTVAVFIFSIVHY